jgi:hypothetical protein
MNESLFVPFSATEIAIANGNVIYENVKKSDKIVEVCKLI